MNESIVKYISEFLFILSEKIKISGKAKHNITISGDKKLILNILFNDEEWLELTFEEPFSEKSAEDEVDLIVSMLEEYKSSKL